MVWKNRRVISIFVGEALGTDRALREFGVLMQKQTQGQCFFSSACQFMGRINAYFALYS